LALSIVALVGAGIVWRATASEPPRADLVADSPGDAPAVTSTTVTTGSTTTAPPPTSAPGTRFAAQAPPTPTSLVIPAIDVDVAIVPVGIRADGGMEIPSTTEAGWFEPGVHPGAPFGSAVIAAHIDFGGKPGAFFRLREIQVGEQVVVRLADGTDRTYQVTERNQVAKQDLPTEEVFRRNGPPVLTLVTCGGAFDRSARHYRDNIVVRAVPI
jgi:LPXTG-site transpeptidase (sortase) family protein